MPRSKTLAPLSLLLSLLTLALALSACGSSSTSSTAPAGGGGSSTKGFSGAGTTITVYSGQHEQTTALLVAGFEKQTGIKAKVRSDGEDVLGNQILQEGSSSPADVFYAENTPVLEHLQEKGLLAPLSAATLASVPTKFSSPQSDWMGVSARVSVLEYNTSLIKPSELPRSILELAQPRWKGKIGFAPSETDFQPLVTAISKLDGIPAAEKWLQGIQANGKVYPDNETVVSQVNSGESAVGIINHYYWYRLRDEVGRSGLHSALQFYAPHDPGYLLNVSGAAVLKSSSQQAAAQRFVAFLVSKAGQEILAHSHSYEYPLGSGVLLAQPLKPFDRLQPAPVTIADLGNGSAPLELEQKLGLL